jgi:hypothetical protein
MTMELKKERSTLLRQKSSSGENDAVRGEERRKQLVETEI